MSICYHANCYLVSLYMYIQPSVSKDFAQGDEDLQYVEFAQNVSFKGYGIVCPPQWPLMRSVSRRHTVDTPSVLDNSSNENYECQIQ